MTAVCVSLAMCISFAAAPHTAHAGPTHDPLMKQAEQTFPEAALGAKLFDIVNTGQRLVVAGERGHIFFSDDNGATWAQAEVPVSITLTALAFPVPAIGWAVGHDGVILKTTDSGSSWQLQMDGNQVNELLSKQIRDLIQVKKTTGEGLEIDDLEYFLQDAESTLEGGPARHFMDVWFKNETQGFAIGAYGLIFATEDGGKTWVSIFDRLDNIDAYHYYGITPAGASLFIAGEVGMLFRSDDEGRTWTRLASPYEGSFFGIIASPLGDTVIAYGMEGQAYRTSDMGASWTLLNIDNRSPYSGGAVLTDGSIILSGSNGDLFFNPKGSSSFTKLAVSFPECAAMTESNPGQLLLTGINGLFKTTTSK